LVLCLGELGNVDMTFNAIFVESGLKDLVVVDELVLVLCLPLNSTVWECSRVQTVHNATVDGGSCTLFNLGDAKLAEKCYYNCRELTLRRSLNH
jgi:hypothetical protein